MSYDTSVDRPPTLVHPVGGATCPARKHELFGASNDRTNKKDVEFTVLSCNAGMSAKAKAEDKYRRMKQDGCMSLVCTDINAQN